jgi:GNAT superfamily N-acetyltransferase
MIRLTKPDDIKTLLALAEATGLFESNQVEELAQMLNQHFNDEANSQGVWLTDCDNELGGVAYVAPERMSNRTRNLYLMAIHPNHQKQGRGAELLQYVEQMLAKCGECRAFYRNRGYEEEARIRDFYTDGFDKIVFRKLLGSVAA